MKSLLTSLLLRIWNKLRLFLEDFFKHQSNIENIKRSIVIRIYFQNRFVRYSQSISLKDYQKVICFNFRKTLLSFFLQWKELGTGIWSGHVVLGNFEIFPILTYYPLLSCPPPFPPPPPQKKMAGTL
jgi:hypothetical protein